MPSLGADMEAGTLVEWKVKVGDTVKRGQIVAVVDTNKGAIDIEIWQDGVVDEILVQPFAKVPVGTALAVVRAAGEAPAPRAAPPGATAALPAPAAVVPPSLPGAAAPPTAAPGPPHVAVSPPSTRPRASPAARGRARELAVDLAAVRGTGPGGVVTLADVEEAARRPASGVRQAIAAAMARSKREIPHYYVGTEMDLSLALAWLAAENERRPVTERLLLVAVLLKAVALSAREVPEVNGLYVDGAFRQSPAVHLGLAIALRRGGLVAPALHDVDRKSVGELMRDVNDLVARARSGGLRSSELSDATLTVTSLGDLGVATVYGVIYPPQVALVGFGRVLERPCAIGGRVEVRPVMVATLSGDHRVSDGIRGAAFLAAIDRHLQAPEAL